MEYIDHITTQAVAFNGQAGVVVNLIGGGSLTGTVACTTTTTAFGVFSPLFLTVTDSGSKAHTVRMDHISSIGK